MNSNDMKQILETVSECVYAHLSESAAHYILNTLEEKLLQQVEPQQDEWQPIDTAPRDGTRILGWCGNYTDICYLENKWIDSAVGLQKVWMTDSCVDFGGYENPTHWMPLPNPPAAV